MRRAAHHHASARGLTVLELMVVLAIIGGSFVLVRSGFRMVSKTDLVESSTELAAVIRRTSQLAIEKGELHRIVFELGGEKPDSEYDPTSSDPKKKKPIVGYLVEVCQGATAITRNEAVKPDEDAKKRAIERGALKLQGLPTDAFAAGDPEEATRRASAISGAHIGDRTCVPATEGLTYDATGKGWARALRTDIKLKEIWVQHKDEGTTKGQVALYFWPMGSSEKAAIELTDGDEIFTITVSGLTGRVDLHDGAPRSIDDLMLKNVMGNRDAKREDLHQ
jgi:general secretion pathway protein H